MRIHFSNGMREAISKPSEMKIVKLIDKTIRFVNDNKLLDIPQEMNVRFSQFNHKPLKGAWHEYCHTLEINPLFSLLTETITVHELVHAEQYLHGRLTNCKKTGQMRWKKKSYDDVDYMQLPWEIEAYEKQAKILQILKDQKDVSY